MNARHWIIASITCIFLASATAAQTTDDARINALVRKLGSPAYVQREQARKELEAIGVPALDALRRAAKTADVETSRRLSDLISRFEEQLTNQQILAPTEVHLKLKDASVQQAIAELAKQSGYPIQFLGDAIPFADKKITLDTGKISFWQGLDRLSAEAGLMERVDLSVQSSQAIYSRMAKNGMRRPIYVPQQAAQAGPITLTNRTNEKSYFQLNGSLKTELRVSRDAKTKELTLMFIVSPEPRMTNTGVLGKPIFDKALDQANRKFEEPAPPKSEDAKPFDPDASIEPDELIAPLRRFTQVKFKDDKEAVKAIKEISGKLAYQLDLENETLAKIDNVMDAAGKSAAMKSGGSLRVLGVRKKLDDYYIVDVVIENAMNNMFGNNIVINGGAVIIRGNVNLRGGVVIGPGGVRMNGDGTNKDLPDLLDAKGRKFKIANVEGDTINFINGSTTRTAQILFEANPGQGAPRDLVLFGTRTHTLAVPFRFENVPLP